MERRETVWEVAPACLLRLSRKNEMYTKLSSQFQRPLMYEASVFWISLDRMNSVSGDTRPARNCGPVSLLGAPAFSSTFLYECCCFAHESYYEEWSFKVLWQMTTRMPKRISLQFLASFSRRPREWWYSSTFCFCLKDSESCNWVSCISCCWEC